MHRVDKAVIPAVREGQPSEHGGRSSLTDGTAAEVPADAGSPIDARDLPVAFEG